MTSLALMPSNRRRLPGGAGGNPFGGGFGGFGGGGMDDIFDMFFGGQGRSRGGREAGRSAVRICALIWKLPLKKQLSA